MKRRQVQAMTTAVGILPSGYNWLLGPDKLG